jgi:hypothetical protein
MDMKDVMNHIREDLREQPDSHFSEIHFRTVKRGPEVPLRAKPSLRC